ALVYQPLHRVGEVELRSLPRHLHMPSAGLRFHEEKEVACAVTHVFIIIALWSPRLSGQRLPSLLDESLNVANFVARKISRRQGIPPHRCRVYRLQRRAPGRRLLVFIDTMFDILKTAIN